MEPNWPACYAATRKYEGGNDDDKRDPGGRTSRGILQREWTPYVHAHPLEKLPADVWQAPESAIENIYETQYWDAVDGDAWPPGCDMTVWDAGVNSGVPRSQQWATGCLNVKGTWTQLAAASSKLPDKTTFIHAFNGKRLSFLHGLGTFVTFGHGWTVRVTGVEALSCKMAGDTSATLKKKAADASKTATQHGTATAGAGGAAGYLSTLSNHPVILSLVLAVGVIAAAYFAWNWYVHNERTKALEAAANG